MTINGEQIREFMVVGDEQGIIQDGFTNLLDVYNFIKMCVRSDRELHIEDEYTVSIVTDTTCWNGYKIRKYKNKIYLK